MPKTQSNLVSVFSLSFKIAETAIQVSNINIKAKPRATKSSRIKPINGELDIVVTLALNMHVVYNTCWFSLTLKPSPLKLRHIKTGVFGELRLSS